MNFDHTNLQGDRDHIYSNGLPETTAINFWQKMAISEVFKYRCIPFVSYATIEEEPDFIYLNVIPMQEWQAKRKVFSESTKDFVCYHYADGYIDHVYTNDNSIRDLLSSFALRHGNVNGVFHFNKQHPWLFDIYCMVSKKNGSLDTALSPVYYIRDFMRKSKRIIMPVDQYLLGEHNIDGTELCKSVQGVGKSSSIYVKCDRKNCTCYNPFRGRDFRSVMTKTFYKHLSITEYRDRSNEMRIGYVFSKDSNPNCINCRGARGVCPCKDNYRNALMLRDSSSMTAVTHIYVLGGEGVEFNSQNYHLSFITDLDMYQSRGTAVPYFFVPDGKTIWQYEKKENFIREFRRSIKVYSLSPVMYLSLQNTDDDTITSIITPMNLFTNDELPFNREEGVQDQLQERFAKQLKIIEEVKKNNSVMSNL